MNKAFSSAIKLKNKKTAHFAQWNIHADSD